MPTYAEVIAPDEQERFERYGAEMRALQKRAAEKRGVTTRALHVKQHLGARGELVVGELPEPLRVALFARPGTWRVYVRFSNGSSRRGRDGVPDARGVAVKVVGVPGRKIIPGLEDAQTQDFLFIAEPSIVFRGPDEFMTFVRIRSSGASPAAVPLKVLGAYGLFRGLSILGRLAKLPKVTSMATHPFYTAAPLRFGETAAKLALIPLSSSAVPPGSGDDALREDLIARLQAGPLEWSLRVQLFADERTTPIEDTSVEWKTPFTEVARLVLPKQAKSDEQDALVERLSFDPWHAVEELRPLGAVMRARAVAYRESVIERGAAPEPTA